VYDENRLWCRSWNNHGGLRSRTVLDLVVLVAAGAAYGANRWIGASGFFRMHFDDLLAGAILLAWSNLLTWPHTEAGKFVSTVGGGLAITAFAALIWEGLAPEILPHRTQDPVDVIAYFAGALAYMLAVNVVRAMHRRRADCCSIQTEPRQPVRRDYTS
jgi:hypothetical protein